MSNKTIGIIADKHNLYDDRLYWKQAISLQKAGYTVYFIIISPTENSHGKTEQGIFYYLIKRKRYFSNRYLNACIRKLLPVPAEFKQVYKICAQLKAAVYQLVDLRTNSIVTKLKQLPHAPKLLYDIHEDTYNLFVDITMRNWKMPYFLKRMYARSLEQWEYRKAKNYDYIIGTERGIERPIQQNLPQIPYTNVYNYTNLHEQYKEVPLEQKKYDLGYVGGISEVRGIMVLAQAVKLLKAKYPDIRVLILGYSSDLQFSAVLKNFIDHNHLSNHIFLPDFVPHHTIAAYYNQIKIAVNPLLYTKRYAGTLPIKIFEYMGFGIPIVTSDFGDFARCIRENEAGLFATPGDAADFAQKIDYLLQHPQEIMRLGQNGRKAVVQQYNWHIMEKTYIKIVDNLANDKTEHSS